MESNFDRNDKIEDAVKAIYQSHESLEALSVRPFPLTLNIFGAPPSTIVFLKRLYLYGPLWASTFILASIPKLEGVKTPLLHQGKDDFVLNGKSIRMIDLVGNKYIRFVIHLPHLETFTFGVEDSLPKGEMTIEISHKKAAVGLGLAALISRAEKLYLANAQTTKMENIARLTSLPPEFLRSIRSHVDDIDNLATLPAVCKILKEIKFLDNNNTLSFPWASSCLISSNFSFVDVGLINTHTHTHTHTNGI
ncbi:hsp70 nucleotide exchange factor FES1-like protein [Corchorus olitorius]|uniref:Hsp70 nucleotide exchange factor FES1-like protein n=1 Tax=Corchorus olitorius TaxID=93759 RepID=A0A1R3KTJ2_9ROSI|nr:hsp70 nucleotide exchange factor FES1-like protein [Corchorus olitorius]